MERFFCYGKKDFCYGENSDCYECNCRNDLGGVEEGTLIEIIHGVFGDDYDLDRLCQLVSQRMTMREDVAERMKLVGDMPIDRLRELVEADRDGRCVVLPKDGMLYFLEESIDSGEKWVGNWPVKDVFFKCGFGLASLSYSIQDIGSKIYLTREAAEAALKGE